MAASYLRRGMTGTATFSLFVRSLPAMRGFLVAAGVESCLDLLADFSFEEDDIRYLRETQGYAERDLEAFRKLRFTGDVWAIPEGRIALAGEPVLEVTAPLPEAQLVETLFLNQVTFETRTGIKHAIEVIKELGLGGLLGIRIDSGDLVALSKRGRRLLDGAGLAEVRIFASGGLDELAIDELVSNGALIDAFGVGTRMGVSADHPYLDTAYKLVSYKGRPVMKLSRGKVSAPGRKQVFRRSKPFSDLVGLHDEKVPAGREALLERLMVGGARVGGRPPLAQVRSRFAFDLECLPASARAIRSPRPLGAQSTPRLRNLTAATRQKLVMS